MTIRYTIDPGSSRFTVQAFASGMLSAFAHSPTFAIRDFSGELRFSSEALTDAVFELTVKADSLAAADSVSPRDRAEIESRMRAEVLETAAYPEIVFQSTDVAADRVAENWHRLRIQGNLSLHGVTHAERIDAQLRLPEEEMRLSGECRLLLSTYRIKRVSALGGMIQLKDELRFSFDLAGRKAST
jgi:polyisoprenoid-binding protein YceI